MDLAFMLSHTSHVLSTELTAELAGLGITPRGSCVLASALTGEHTQIQLADMCGLDKTTMVVTVDELEKAGLVERQTSPTDRRARIIVVTPQGREMSAKAADVIDRVHEDVLASLPDGEREGLVAGLTRLVENRLSRPVQCERAPRRRN
ncbi:MarR family winged helix-turn-helix transcriptional regulator [Actinophytocola sp. NPDC049390]|uniref:MarR family winged helix-turn-helix transcriptional regulator n=1 Tax=Actinophytocola sp. NPDC049390 TaxID=3363894 RepID=UPI00378C0EBF